MPRMTIPLYYRRLENGLLHGKLIGCDFSAIAPDLKKLKASCQEWIRQAQREGKLAVAITQASLACCEIEVYPTAEDETGRWPAVAPLKLPVYTVTGPNRSGFFECFLPDFPGSFSYYRPEQFMDLLRHFVTHWLFDTPLAEIYALIMEPGPQLLEIIVKERDEQPPDDDEDGTLEILPIVAEKYPSPRNAGRIGHKPQLDTTWERETELRQLQEKIGAESANLLLVGPDGVGKSALLRHAIRQIYDPHEKCPLFFRTTPERMLSQARYLGDWQAICDRLVEELKSCGGVLWLENFITMFLIGGDGPEDSLAAYLRPLLLQGRLRIVSEVTPAELEAARRLAPAVVDLFETVLVTELDPLKIKKLLGHFQEYIRRNWAITLETPALELSLQLLGRYLPYESFPGKAMKFLMECLNQAQLARQHRIDHDFILAAFIQKIGLPAILLRDDLTIGSNELYQHFAATIIGQDAAIHQLVAMIQRFKSGLHDPSKPIASLLFAGPSGVGKTATVKALANYFFGAGQRHDPLIRLDMSELQSPAQIDRLIGGSTRQPGQLIRLIRENPFSVVLFDEIEKADRAIFDVLLAVLDEGRLVDAAGRVADFRNSIIVMTSNLGAERRSSIGFDPSAGADFLAAIQAFFRPEFYNRLDLIIPFRPLDRAMMRQITRKELRELAQRPGLQQSRLRLRYSDELIEFLIESGFDRRYGARPLQRAIEQRLTPVLARFLLEHEGLTDAELRLDYRAAVGVLVQWGELT